MPNIVVIGAGVSGLTSALLLARDKKNKVAVVARHMPGDYDIEYTSPWAGANVLPMATDANSRWERETWPEMRRLAAEVPEAGVHFQKAWVLRKGGEPADTGKGRLSDALFDENPWFKPMMDNYKDLPADKLPPGIQSGSEFGSVCINTALYLPYLVGQCRALGVVFRRAVLNHISEAADYAGLASQPDGTTAATAAPDNVIIVNCCGLLACRLGGVMDDKVQPARGQVVVIREELSPMLALDRVDDEAGERNSELLYNMLRPGGGGTIVGGTYQVGNWESQPDPSTAVRLLTRLAATHPQLIAQGKTAADLSIIRQGVGLRPYRAGGVRLETEQISLQQKPSAKVWVVHNYGHAGWGYQGSYGCSKRVVELVDEVAGSKISAKL